MDNNQLDAQNDISRFLEKFQQDVPAADLSVLSVSHSDERAASYSREQDLYDRSFEKLEEKIRELEDKFEASSAQNKAVMRELARTREAVENQQSKDAFFANITATIANLKESVENLSRTQKENRLYEPSAVPVRSFDSAPSSGAEYLSMAAYLPDSYRSAQQSKLQAERAEKERAVLELKAVRAAKEQAQSALQEERKGKEQTLLELQQERRAKERAENALYQEREDKHAVLGRLRSEQDAKLRVESDLLREREEKQAVLERLQEEQTAKSHAEEIWSEEKKDKERILSSLRQKTSQLKAVNVAMDREIKRVQQEKMEALRKSAEQAKEILSLRDALTQAEERFKSFDFEGRIISVKRQYQQKVTTLENQLHEISNTCMKQVEEIESLKSENLKLHRIAEEREQLAALYEAKTHELEALRADVERLRSEDDVRNRGRLAAFTLRMHRLQEEHDALAGNLKQTQEILRTVNAEKQTLEENFKALLGKIEENDAVIQSLKEKISVLTSENKELKDRAAKPSLRRPEPKEPVTVRQSMPKSTAAPASEKQIPPAPQTAPVQMQQTLRSKVQTEADLPEIRVAQPVVQEELYNGEDFLEKTDSFIGRMKWSIFREDK